MLSPASFSLSALAVVLLQFKAADAQLYNGGKITGPTAFTQSVCRTVYGPSQTLVSTVVNARTITFNPAVIVGATSVSTVTTGNAAATATTTSTITSVTTLPLVTDTFTKTTTSTSTSTASFTVSASATTTVTSTLTIGGGTSTIAAPAGFIYPTTTSGGLKARDDNASAPLRRAGAVVPRQGGGHKSPHVRNSPNRYPAKVICDVLVENIIPRTITVSGVPTTLTKTASATATSTVFATVTSTSTRADASVTLLSTAFATTTVSRTTTVGGTSTVSATATFVAPAIATVYAACLNPLNMLSVGANGNPLTIAYISTSVTSQDLITANAYDCCALCFQTTGCLGSNYAPSFPAASCELEISSTNTCPANQGGQATVYGETTNANDLDLVISNGPCGTNLYTTDVVDYVGSG